MTLRRDTNEARKLLVELGLDGDLKDDVIVTLAVRLCSEGLDTRVATANGGLEMKLEDRDIPVIALDDRWRLQPEPDPEKLRADKAERELKAQRDRPPKLLVAWEQSGPLTWQGGHGNVERYIQSALAQAEQVYLATQSGRNHYPTDRIYNPGEVARLGHAEHARHGGNWEAAWLALMNWKSPTAPRRSPCKPGRGF